MHQSLHTTGLLACPYYTHSRDKFTLHSVDCVHVGTGHCTIYHVHVQIHRILENNILVETHIQLKVLHVLRKLYMKSAVGTGRAKNSWH